MRLLDDDELAQFVPSARVRRVPISFSGTATEMAEPPLDLNDVLVLRPGVTFYLEMRGNALLDSGIHAGDVLVVDRSLPAPYGAIVVVAFAGELLVRHYCPDSAAIHLLPAHPDFAPLSIRNRERCQVWGVVTAVIHRLHRR